MQTNLNILYVSSEKSLNRNLPEVLEKNGYSITHCYSPKEAFEELNEKFFGIVILDLENQDVKGTEIIPQIGEQFPFVKIVILSDKKLFPGPAEILKLGGYDYLWKPVNPVVLLHVVSRIEELIDLHEEVKELKDDIKRREGFSRQLIGKSSRIREVMKTIDAVSKNRSTVLIQGETGTGKELVAKRIHQKGNPNLPFIGINCGAFSETLLESQIFGHVKGAYTGAIQDHEGVFREAGEGTLFLDEISEIPLHLQVKFLRALQEKEVTPLGSKKVYPIKARIIAASNRDLEQLVKEKKFRDDLFYRLNVVTIKLPPLKERKEDLSLLADHFNEEFASQYGRAKKSITQEAYERMKFYPWPGNIRELQNVIERSFALSESEKITLEDIPLPLRIGKDDINLPQEEEELLSLEDQERLIIAKALKKAEGEKTAAAKILKIDRNRLARKMVKYGLA